MIYPMGRNVGPSLGGFIVGATFASRLPYAEIAWAA